MACFSGLPRNRKSPAPEGRHPVLRHHRPAGHHHQSRRLSEYRPQGAARPGPGRHRGLPGLGRFARADVHRGARSGVLAASARPVERNQQYLPHGAAGSGLHPQTVRQTAERAGPRSSDRGAVVGRTVRRERRDHGAVQAWGRHPGCGRCGDRLLPALSDRRAGASECVPASDPRPGLHERRAVLVAQP